MAGKTKRQERRTVNSLADDISNLIAQFHGVVQKAKELGIFTNDRDLLQCTRCGLAEDVACGGRLITIESTDGPFTDTGLRFKEIDSTHFRCPRCNSILDVAGRGEAGNGK
ncbi:MAG: hypothetical protein QME66_08570 [Candidatus Eisenbacteria bacterium]|nr:hypothetical protein [Candidatus Eisenbacteria bacterium]